MDGMAEGAVTTDKETIENVFNTLSTLLGRHRHYKKKAMLLYRECERVQSVDGKKKALMPTNAKTWATSALHS